jgi:hypothetical protein
VIRWGIGAIIGALGRLAAAQGSRMIATRALGIKIGVTHAQLQSNLS